MRNNSIEGLYEDDGEMLSLDEDMPLLRDGGFNSKFQSINNLVQDAKNEEVSVKPVAPSPVKTNSKVQITRTPSRKNVEVQSNIPKHEPRVTTPEKAKEIGADFYCKDAMASVRCAEKLHEDGEL